MLDQLFFQIGLVLVVAAAASLVVFRLRQPLIIGYILAGIIIGPSIFAFARTSDTFHAMSEIGVAFLLFTVGLSLNWRRVKEVGWISLFSGVGQVVFTTILGYLIGLAIGMDQLTAFFLALAFSFSSTIIIVKLLADKEELDRLYGRIAVGFLIVQDIIAMVVLLVLGALEGGMDVQNIITITLGKGLVALLILWFLSAKVVPHLVAYAAKSLELLFLFSIGWCFAIAGLLHFLGFGIEIGALLAGVALSGTIYHNEINARVRPLRDFFLIIFFIILGARLEIAQIGDLWLPILAFSAFILIGNPLVVMIIMRVLRYHPRTSFMTGATVGQISEFGFIVLASGLALGHVSNEANTLAVFIALITIAGSAYMIKFNEQIYDKVNFLFRWLEPPEEKIHGAKEHRDKIAHTTLIGFHRIGEHVYPELKKINKNVRVVDLNPTVIDELREDGIEAHYGDAGDERFLKEIRMEKSKMIVSTVPDGIISLDLLNYLRRRRYKGTVIVTCRTPEEAHECYEAGASFVIVPNVLGAERFSGLLKRKKTSRKAWMESVN